MDAFKDDYIRSFSTLNQTRASYMLEAAKVSKSQVERLVERLQDSISFTTVQLPKETRFSLIKGSQLAAKLREAHNAIDSIYGESNNISDILESYSGILMSEIKALENELASMEKAIDNYAFLLSDAQAYDYSFLEPFSDNLGRATDLQFLVPDRGNQTFMPLQAAAINPSEGVLTLAPELAATAPIGASVVYKSNASSMVVDSSNFSSVVDGDLKSGWRMSIQSSTIIDKYLDEFDYVTSEEYDVSGIQVIGEISLASPSPCDTVVLTGYADIPTEIVQVRLFDTEQADSWVDILNEPITIDGTVGLSFPTQPVAKVHLFMRQGVYSREAYAPIPSELQYQRVHEEIKTAKTPKEPTYRGAKFQREIMLFTDFLIKNKKASMYTASLPEVSFNKDWGMLSRSPEILEGEGYVRSTVDNSSNRMKLIYTVASRMGIGDWLQQVMDQSIRSIGSGGSTQTADNRNAPAIVASIDLSSNTQPYTGSQDYRYSIGLRDFKIGCGGLTTKGYFVSNIIDSIGAMGEVKLRASHTNAINTSLERDTEYITSVEYSVTNVSTPFKETDWIPIVPVGQDTVYGERLFPDDIGKCFFRFPASRSDDIVVYVNGVIIDVPINTIFIQSDDQQHIIGVRLPAGSYSSTSILTADYTTAWDHSHIRFADFENISLASSFDNTGAGEGFDGLFGSLQVTLDNVPYINYTEVDRYDYDPVYGLENYAPITVKLADGSIAHNLTNYKGGTQTGLNPGSGMYQYIHSGNMLTFNKQITEPFRVYYQYVPNNVRVRVVLRSNTTNSWASPKVDFYQLKAKVRHPDARRKI